MSKNATQDDYVRETPGLGGRADLYEIPYKTIKLAPLEAVLERNFVQKHRDSSFGGSFCMNFRTKSPNWLFPR